jgi:hypothetical protein
MGSEDVRSMKSVWLRDLARFKAIPAVSPPDWFKMAEEEVPRRVLSGVTE